MEKVDKFVGLSASGHAENFKEGSDWYSILSSGHQRLMTGDHGRPQTLIRNGEIVQTKLDDVAYAYGEQMRKELEAAARKVRQQFMPPWRD